MGPSRRSSWLDGRVWRWRRPEVVVVDVAGDSWGGRGVDFSEAPLAWDKAAVDVDGVLEAIAAAMSCSRRGREIRSALPISTAGMPRRPPLVLH